MADAAKSDEIEDVLSSIRRLVSEHQAPARASAAQVPVAPDDSAEGTPGPDAMAEALILTPALRVTDPEDPWVPIKPSSGDAEDTDLADSASDRPRELLDGGDSTEDVDPDADAIVAERDPQLQADQWEAGDLPVQDAAPADEDPALDPPLDVTEAALVSSGTPEPPAGAGDEDEEDVDEDIPLSFIRSTSSVSDYEPEEGDGLDDSDLPQAMRSLAQSRAAQRAEQAEEKKPAERGRYRVEIVKAALAEGAAEEAAGDETTREAADGADQAELAAAADTGDADGTLTDRMADAPPEETRDTSGADVEDLGEAPFTFPDDGDSFVDEEALRELVAEVVREELQGEMGVRITRNIRKLVRREIRLALAAQDLD